jgi:M6 family metalloprotease-like protein
MLAAEIDLREYRTVATAIKLEKAPLTTQAVSQPGYLGVTVEMEKGNRLVISNIDASGPALKAGVEVRDQIESVDGQTIATVAAFREHLQTKSPNDVVILKLVRGNKKVEAKVTLAPTSRPLSTTQRAVLGIQTQSGSGGTRVTGVSTGSPAELAGIRTGDIILRVDSQELTEGVFFPELLMSRVPGDAIQLTIKRGDKEMVVKTRLIAETLTDTTRGGMRWDDRLPRAWKKPTYRLAVIPISYPDVAPNPKVTTQHWHDSFFSKDTWIYKSPTGQSVYGSLYDYYQELSCGVLKVEGKVFDWVKVSKKRTDYLQSTNRTALLTEAADALLKRDGPKALSGFDGIFFIFAGGRVATNRGTLYWPHRANFSYGGQRWPYFICPEGGDRMANISVTCHEFGHMLGLPDLYARPENPGSEGVGAWCAMSNQAGNGLPQHFSAWSKEQLGWIKPCVIDPAVKQKLILGPIERSTTECFKIPVRPDGSEYLLLENRRKKGFDVSLPGEGLLIWRVLDNKPFLEESHGITGPDGPRRFLGSVPFPSPSNSAFTPYTTPSSRSQKGGGVPVHITNIQRLPDGRVTFHVGYEYY